MRGTLLLALLVVIAAADDLILKPVKEGNDEVALIFIQGAQIRPDQYTPLAKAIQAASEYKLWVGIPEFWLDTAEPIVLAGGIKRIMASLVDAGMKATSVFFAGHSLGGIMLQDYLFANSSVAKGQILLGSFLTRKYANKTFPVPTLTTAGDLDGLCRLTRLMEAFYRYSNANESRLVFPVIVVPGMNHMQIASGDPPAFVKQFDLQAEISSETAHAILGKITAGFISLQLNDKSQVSVIEGYVEKTSKIVQPLFNAFEMEGFYHFKPPCYDNPPSPACTLGSKWSSMAQSIMADLPEGTVTDTDTFHPVWQINPVHLPHLLNSCSSPSQSCALKSVTVTQNVYEALDKLDTAFFPVSASEIRVKLKSRQAMMQAAGYGTLDFNKTDSGSICQQINEASYKWALANAGASTAARFNKYGQPMIMGEDKGPYNAGPLWIWKALEYNKKKDSSGNEVIVVQSIMMRTPVDYFIKASSGFHYCKLLSPARAMEWMYVDGLRAHRSINSKKN